MNDIELDMVAGGKAHPKLTSKSFKELTDVIHTIKNLLVKNKDKIFDTIFPNDKTSPKNGPAVPIDLYNHPDSITKLMNTI